MTKLISYLLSVPMWFMNELTGNLLALGKADKLLKERLKKLKSGSGKKKIRQIKLPLKYIESFYRENLERLRIIEDKARSTVFGIALAVTLSPAGFAVLVNSEVQEKLGVSERRISAFLFILAILFLLVSGFLALFAYNVGSVYLRDIEDHPALIGSKKLKTKILQMIDLNNIYILRKANFLSSSMDCLRNALFFIFVFLFHVIYRIVW